MLKTCFGSAFIFIGSYLRLSCVLACLAAVFFVPCAEAYVVSEERQFQTDIDEAVARARDFQNTMNRLALEEKDLEQYGYEAKEQKARESEEYERLRQQYVLERDGRPDPVLEREQQERAYLRQQEREEREMEEAREKYVEQRDRVREVMSREAYINEMVEYGLDAP